MRVLLVADVSAESVLGGAERMLVNHVRAIHEAGHQLTVLSRQPLADAPLRLQVTDGVDEYRLPFSGDKGPSGLMQLRREAQVWWRKHAGDFDVVVAEQPFVMWALLQAGCTLPRLQVCHSFAFQEYATRHGLDWNLRHRLITAAMRRLEAGVYCGAERMLVLSRHMQGELQTFFSIPSDIVDVAPGGVAIPESVDEAVRQAMRNELGWQGPVVVTLRNLVPRTGVDLLVQTAAIVRRFYPDVRWCVIGDGGLRDGLQWLSQQLGVEDIIDFSGYLSEEEKQKRMLAADAFMIPTRSLEGFGLVTIEANACGLPVIATPVGGNVEVASSSPDNRLADATSPEALAREVISLLDEASDHESRSRRLREHIQASFPWKQHDQGLLESMAKAAS